MTRSSRRAAAAASLAILAVAGCGSSDPSTVSRTTDASATPTFAAPASPEAASTAPAAPAGPCKATAPTTDLAKKPVVVPPAGSAPTTTTTIDLVCGTGAVASPGAQVAVKYVGALYRGGKEFDSSWKNGPRNTLPFQVGAGQLIPGFDQGSVGMRVGGRREILIPSAQGYGDQGSPPGIPPGADLIFVIDLVAAG